MVVQATPLGVQGSVVEVDIRPFHVSIVEPAYAHPLAEVVGVVAFFFVMEVGQVDDHTPAMRVVEGGVSILGDHLVEFLLRELALIDRVGLHG